MDYGCPSGQPLTKKNKIMDIMPIDEVPEIVDLQNRVNQLESTINTNKDPNKSIEEKLNKFINKLDPKDYSLCRIYKKGEELIIMNLVLALPSEQIVQDCADYYATINPKYDGCKMVKESILKLDI